MDAVRDELGLIHRLALPSSYSVPSFLQVESAVLISLLKMVSRIRPGASPMHVSCSTVELYPLPNKQKL